jgi:hypothetical protein
MGIRIDQAIHFPIQLAVTLHARYVKAASPDAFQADHLIRVARKTSRDHYATVLNSIRPFQSKAILKQPVK